MFDGKSLFQLTAERNKGVTDTVMVVGNKDNYHLSKANWAAAGITSYLEIIEAEPRNTAAAIAFAALAAQPEDVLLITHSDHIIDNQVAYHEAITQAIHWAQADVLVTFGIAPTKPETGYGYIEYHGNDVLSFREKPDFVTAQSFIDQGMFCGIAACFVLKRGCISTNSSATNPCSLKKRSRRKRPAFCPLPKRSTSPPKALTTP